MTDYPRTTDAGDFPAVVLLDTTNHCNLKCSMCGHRIMTRPKGKMSMTLFRRLIDEIAAEGKNTRVWMVFFGEALTLQYRLMWQILYAKRKGLTDVVLNSNGTLLDNEMSRALVESKLDAIYIGIDAFDRGTYSRIRVGGDYDKVVSNVNGLLDMKRKLGASSPRVFVQFVEMEENRNEAKPFVEYWTQRGVQVKIRPKVTWAGSVPSWNTADVERYPCYWAMRTINICWDGSVALCSVDYDARYVAGNVRDCTIRSIWQSSLRAIRDAQTRGDYTALPKFCQECTDWQMARAEYHGNG